MHFERETIMSHESIPLILYALGIALFIAVAWVHWTDQVREAPAISRR